MSAACEVIGLSRVNILQVDDELSNLIAVRAILESLGQNLVEARSGEEALRLLLDRDFAVVLLDVQMRGLDGFETARRIRAGGRSRQTPIIFLTGHDQDRLSVDRAYGLGAVDYLVKPIVPQVLRAKVEVFVELFQKSEQIRQQGERLRELEREKAEQALTASEARKAAILDIALDGIITIDHRGTILEFNPAAERIFGYQRAEVLGLDMAELILPVGLRERYYQGLARYLETGKSSHLNRWQEMLALARNGQEVPVELAITRSAGDGPPVFTGFVRDISDRRRAEQRRAAQLAVSQVLAETPHAANALANLLRAVGENVHWSAGAIWIVDARDQVLRCVEFWHSAAVQIPEFKRATHERTFVRGAGLPGRVWATGQPLWLADVTLDANFPRAAIARREGLHGAFAFPVVLKGQVFGVIEFFNQSIQQPDADLLAMMATVGLHIGQYLDRKRAEEELKAGEQRFAGFMENLPGLAWIKDLHGRYVFVNDAAEKAFGMARADLYGKQDSETFPAETAAVFRDNDQRALASSSGIQTVETLTDPEGVLHYSLVSKFPIVGPEGRPDFIGGIAIDITDRKRLEDELLQASRRKDEFLATLAHELRNPLAPIRNSLHVLRLTAGAEAAFEPVLQMMERQINHLVRLVDDLLEVSRITRGKIELRRERINLANVLNNAVETARPLMEASRHRLILDLPAEPVPLEADAVRLTQVVTNLLNNASKYMEEGGQIWLSAKPEGSRVTVSVRDSGMGIPAEMLPEVFDMFTQVDESKGRSQGGLGIGLTLVKRLVEMHGGNVEARSEGPGKGSEFLVRLPMARQVAGSPLAGSTIKVEDSVKLMPLLRILVVDDNHDAADSLVILLKLHGAEVLAVYDGPSALVALATFRPAVIFLDLGMPGMNGFEVATRIGQHAEFQPILIALTGWGQEEDRRRTREAGFHYHLVKPVDPNALQSLLGTLGDGRSESRTRCSLSPI